VSAEGRAGPLAGREPAPPGPGRAVPAPRASVVVTACADSPLLRACLAALGEQAAVLGAEVLLVVNAAPEAISADARRALAASVDRLLFEPEPGKSHALNTGVAACRGDAIAFTDDDALPAPGWLAAITGPLLDPARPAALVDCGGVVEPRFPERGTPAWLRELIESKRTYFLGPRHDLGPAPRDYDPDPDAGTGIPIGASCAYRREVFDRYRYDARLGPNRATGARGGEDTLLALQLLRDGFRLRYEPAARVSHPVSPDRMTVAFVRRAHFVQGYEWVRVCAILGRPFAPLRALRAKLLRVRLGLCAARLRLALDGGPVAERRWLQRALKVERQRGYVAGARALRAAATGREPTGSGTA
jgi:glycosyltransferase involved in cell wall biosynthesis